VCDIFVVFILVHQQQAIIVEGNSQIFLRKNCKPIEKKVYILL